eukprot:NODE_6944_length_805_cov_59.799120_g6708_i0.p1 GENE.NODE_6944_length_805_cov_59.799120_g6708_i0~~NODE_6944_length_805_cov_59.799120_g6708_i0.p1  ORF type:complete len:187 (-),score=12.89 NODE_6944_length_805_cov_59.799120_g6708_i0:168-728(-)
MGGYMGVAIAMPLKRFELIDCEMMKVGDSVRFNRPSQLSQWISWTLSPLYWLAQKTGLPFKPVEDFWRTCAFRSNQLVFMRMRARTSGSSPFCVATYHMPCAFTKPEVMMIHSALVGQHTSRMANSDPLVLAGDWNFKPVDQMYKMMTTGDVGLHFPVEGMACGIRTSSASPGRCGGSVPDRQRAF